MVISASWLSRTGKDKHNLRGVATVLSLAGFLKRTSFIPFSDGDFNILL